MIDINLLSSSKRFGKALNPILTVTTVGVLLAGCNMSASADTENDAMMEASSSSSSVEGMMMEASSSSAMSADSSDVMSSEAAMNHLYKDGTYTAAGVYRSPAGGEGVTVSLTLTDDKVTGATFSGDAMHKKSIAMQLAFGEGFKEQVVGKSLDEVSVGVVNGSSLTGGGFMDALAKIKVEAKA